MDSEVFARIRDYLADQLEVEPEKIKEGVRRLWLRHAPAPLLWIHPVAKKHIFAPDDTKMHFFALDVSASSAHVRRCRWF